MYSQSNHQHSLKFSVVDGRIQWDRLTLQNLPDEIQKMLVNGKYNRNGLYNDLFDLVPANTEVNTNDIVLLSYNLTHKPIKRAVVHSFFNYFSKTNRMKRIGEGYWMKVQG